MPVRMLLCGGKGQLGRECERVFGDSFEVYSFGSRDLDITDREKVESTVRSIKPEIVLNCAAYTKVDLCESQNNKAWAVNADGPANLAAACSVLDSLLVHVSTDYVFNGFKKVPEPYVESDTPDPLSIYGKSKLAGEEAVVRGCKDHLIVRTAWLFGETGDNFLKTMLRLALRDPAAPIRVVDDQYGSPTWAYRLALQIKRLVRQGGRGIYHATAEGWCTWFGLADYFLSRMEVPYSIEPITSGQYPAAAKRPANSILENRRLKAEGLNIMLDWHLDVEDFVKESGERILLQMKRGI